jgi:O-methyltransferase involved in polyketide biosynthesis
VSCVGLKAELFNGKGLMMYLPQPEGIALFRRITGQFPSGQFILAEKVLTFLMNRYLQFTRYTLFEL